MKIDLKKLKEAPWEHAHEICSYYSGTSSLYETAFFALLKGDTNHSAIELAKSLVHESRHEGIIQSFLDTQREAAEYHQIMGLLQGTRLQHGKCQPREDYACTHCNSLDKLNKKIDEYTGRPIATTTLDSQSLLTYPDGKS